MHPAAPGEQHLHPAAARSAHSGGRIYQEPAPELRGEYQRDRDRVIHAAAFRRLEYKTQVFVNHEGDMFRTRLTHSIEVAQIARSVVRALGFNEDLTEAIALAHDLGHTPFGHAGQDALNACMRDFGGFEHNLQSLRVVEVLEERYADFRGLNLTFETREGVLKHCSKRNARELGEVGKRFLDGTQPSLEAQLVNLADEIAYNNHDVDDGLRAELLSMEELREVDLFRTHHDQVRNAWPELSARREVHEVVRRMINTQVGDLVATTRAALAAVDPGHIDDIRGAARALAGFSNTVSERHLQLKQFLHQRLYRHFRVHRMSGKAARVVSDLFSTFIEDPALLPPDEYQWTCQLERASGSAGRARGVADYIASMTDRYALIEHGRLFDAARLT